jgi:hypothetical protein
MKILTMSGHSHKNTRPKEWKQEPNSKEFVETSITFKSTENCRM